MRKSLSIGLCCLILCLIQTFRSPLNKEPRGTEFVPHLAQALSESSIVSTQQITIPGYPGAFNPSVVPYQDGYLLSFRYRKRFSSEEIKNKTRTNASFIGVVKLDKQLNVSKKTIQLLYVKSYSHDRSLTAEDARLLNIANRTFIFFNDLPPSKQAGAFALYFGELIEENGEFSLKEPAKLLHYDKAIQIEKNWSPFVSEDKLYVIYSDQPRVILEVDLETGNCKEIARTSLNWNWNWGEIRGGTPAYLLDDRFVTFFHSSIPAKVLKKGGKIKQGRSYLMGAYVFDSRPPFSVRAMIPTPLGGQKDYTENNRHKVVFPGGMVIEDEVIRVVWGKNNSQIFITTFDKKKFLTSMEPIKTISN